MNKLFGILTTLIVLLALVSCDRDHDGKLGESYESQLYDIVTYNGLDIDNHAAFTLVGRDDEPNVELVTTVGAPDKVAPHDRVLLRYAINHKAADGSYWNINAMSVSRIISDSIRVNAKDINTYSMRPIKLISAWRSGEFINIHGQVEFTGKNRYLYMMIDKDTKYDETVKAYLIHELINTPEENVYYWRDFYLSVNVGVFKKDNVPCRTLRLYINDASANADNPTIIYRDFTIK